MNVGEILGLIAAILGLPAAIAAITTVRSYRNERKIQEDLKAQEAKDQAFKDGAHAERETNMQKQIDAAHSKIREHIMPRLEEIEGSVRESNIHFQNIRETQEQMRGTLEVISQSVQATAISVAKLQGKAQS